MNEPLTLDAIPDLPQCAFLVELAGDLWRSSEVLALWLGGSLARGQGDADSDVDLRVALDTDEPIGDTLPEAAQRLEDVIVARHLMRFGGGALLHHLLLSDGSIYDLFLQNREWTPASEARLVLGCRSDALRPKLMAGADPVVRLQAADPTAIRQVISDFWIGQVKHRKVLRRGLPIVAREGELRLRNELLRLYYVLASGNDCGPISAVTIHTFTPVVRAVIADRGDRALAFLGQPMSTLAEITAATSASQAEMAEVGRTVAKRLGFSYPDTAEATARRSWREYLAERG